MTPAERALALVKAQALLEQVASSLDATGYECGTCGLTRRRNWMEWHVREQIDGMVDRIGRVLVRLDNKTATKARPSKEITDGSDE